MCRLSFLNKIICYIFIVSLLCPKFIFAWDIVSNSDVSITARVNGPGDNNSGGGGGGVIGIPTTVNFSGMAYPLSRVYILKDGQVAVATIADPAANFSVSLSGLSTDTYNFSVFGEDSKGRKSSYFSFPIYVTAGTTVNIGNIFLSPTIEIDKSEVKKGDNLIIFGQSIPQKEIVISVHSNPESFYKVVSNSAGAYLYNLDTSFLDTGSHQTKSKAIANSLISQYTAPLSFTVGEENEFKNNTKCSLLRGDLNCDNHVDLVDFSIMAFWYKKQSPPAKVDLNSDGKISLVDFSIMVFNWTG